MTTPCFSQQRRRAFTLIELLVVVAVLALLIGLSIPGLKSAMSSAKQSQCASNMRQIGNGLMLYAVDNEGSLPPCVDQAKLNQFQGAAWSAAIWNYVGYSGDISYPENDLQGSAGADKNIFHCPVTKYYPKARFKEICPPVCYDVGNRFSYAMNAGPVRIATIDSQNPNGSVYARLKISQVKTPSLTAMVMEGHDYQGGPWFFFSAYGLIPHRGGCNVLYFDGHVGWLLYKDVPPDLGYTDPKLSAFWGGSQ